MAGLPLRHDPIRPAQPVHPPPLRGGDAGTTCRVRSTCPPRVHPPLTLEDSQSARDAAHRSRPLRPGRHPGRSDRRGITGDGCRSRIRIRAPSRTGTLMPHRAAVPALPPGNSLPLRPDTTEGRGRLAMDSPRPRPAANRAPRDIPSPQSGRAMDIMRNIFRRRELRRAIGRRWSGRSSGTNSCGLDRRVAVPVNSPIWR
jgi:hypothetical protein